ncbi:MAG: lipid-A-disaccharide synthase [Mariprofundaceae bacterium]|nr:lipid-A-disaccharide synthase [Mariprofundaceae bacterium]
MNTPRPINIFISAGEVSGDMHASSIMRALRKQQKNIKLTAIAGPAMREVGCDTLCRMESLNVMGIGDVLKALPRIYSIGQEVCSWAEKEKPDVAVLVDFPGFNMRLGEKLRRLGIPVLYYIAPKLWAWGHWRAKRLQRAQDRLACILPFEPQWFSDREIDARYVGNPSSLACRHGWSQTELKQRLAMPPEAPLLALLPGSRYSELAMHAQLLAAAYQRIKKEMPSIVGVTPRAPGVTDVQLKPLLDAGVCVLDRLEENYALRADAAIAVSGTATLELALWNVPTVLVYKSSPLTIWLARKLVGTTCAGLANILLDDKPVMPELIQEKATVDAILKNILPLLKKDQRYSQQQLAFDDLRDRLGLEDPSEAVAVMTLDMASEGSRP